MSVDLSERIQGELDVENALAEIRACRAELRTFLNALCNQLEELADELLEYSSTGRRGRQSAGRDALDKMLERFANLTRDFAESIAQLKNESAAPNG